MPFSFYDILDESSEEEQFNSNVLLEDEFDIMMDTDDIIDFNSFEKGKEILAKEEYGVEF